METTEVVNDVIEVIEMPPTGNLELLKALGIVGATILAVGGTVVAVKKLVIPTIIKHANKGKLETKEEVIEVDAHVIEKEDKKN